MQLAIAVPDHAVGFIIQIYARCHVLRKYFCCEKDLNIHLKFLIIIKH